MNIALIFAMEEEAKALQSLEINIIWQKIFGFSIAEFNYNNNQCIAIISGIGKSFSAAAAMLAIVKYNTDLIVNIGTAGGINCKIGSIIISKSAAFHDVDLTIFNYKKGQIPELPLIISATSSDKNIILSGDQFINNKSYVKKLSKLFPNAKAIEMEAASIAAICHKANKKYIFIKKISDLADETSKQDFSNEVSKFQNKIGDILINLLKDGALDRIRT